MTTELDIIRRAEKEDQVVSLYARATPISDIVKKTGLRVEEIEHILQEYRKYTMQDKVLREMSRETILKTRKHYDDLINQMYDIVELARDENDNKMRLSAINSIVATEKQRVDFMQKAGMIADNEIGDQLIESERKQRIIIDILRDISKKYPKIGLEIQNSLKELTGVMEGVPSQRMDK
jgi:deoxyhypusine synthase